MYNSINTNLLKETTVTCFCKKSFNAFGTTSCSKCGAKFYYGRFLKELDLKDCLIHYGYTTDYTSTVYYHNLKTNEVKNIFEEENVFEPYSDEEIYKLLIRLKNNMEFL